VGLLPNAIYIVVEDGIYFEFSNDVLQRGRGIYNHCINVFVLENALAELVFFCPIEYFLCELWLN
jgi:hypothetical protein